VPRISHSLYLRFVDAAESNGEGHDDSSFRRDMNRRFCTHLASQILALLDAFIFPESLDEALPSSQLHSLALVRHSEPRLGESQGPLVASALRLSAVLIALLEPGSVKLLQCASRTRCLVSWALEMNREGVASEPKTKATESSDDMLNRLFIATLMHCHRALGRCSSLLSEIDSSSFEKYFDSRESHKKHHRRLLRTALELRDVVLLIFRGCADLLALSLSSEALDALRSSLEGSQEHRISKESVAKEFLTSYWVTGFTDVEIRRDFAIPEQLSMGNVPLRGDQDSRSGGFSQIEKLGIESKSIAADLNKTLDGCFEDYLETTRLWAETDAVRDLEFEGDTTGKRLAEKYRNEYGEVARSLVLRRGAAENRLRKIVRMAAEPWESIEHWTLATYTDRNGRRTLLVPNRRFTDHKNASYELMMEKEREKAEKERRARLRENQMTEVMRRNAEAFALHDSFVTDDIDVKDDDSTTQPASDGEASEVGSTSGVDSVDMSKQADQTVDDEWDRIETEEYLHVNAEGDVDAWARLFIWSDGEAVVARFETVIVVTVQSSVEGKLLLTTHGLYLQQTGLETSVITKLPVEAQDLTGTDSKHRRWRLARLIEVHGRRYLLRHQALELFFSDGQQLFINFPGGPRDRDRFHAKLRNSCKVRSSLLSMLTIRLILHPDCCAGSYARVS
jgi:PH domain associated with Beige/BEACH